MLSTIEKKKEIMLGWRGLSREQSAQTMAHRTMRRRVMPRTIYTRRGDVNLFAPCFLLLTFS